MITLATASGAKGTEALKRESGNPLQRILVVEDDEAIRRVSAFILARAGYQVDAAEDGVEGWEALQANHFDLLITDNDMPRLSGVELIKKARREGMSLSIILASGLLPVRELERYPWLQLAATLNKPFSPVQLLEVVNQVLRTIVHINFEPETCHASSFIDFSGAAFYPEVGNQRMRISPRGSTDRENAL